MKVETKLILGFLIIYLLFGSAIFVSLYESSKALKLTARQKLLRLTHELNEQMDADINDRIEEFRIYSRDSFLQQFVSESNSEFEKLSDIQAYINQKDNEWISAQPNEITPFMKQLIGNRLSEDLKNRAVYYEGNYGYKLYGKIFVTNKYGANAAQTGKTADYGQDDEEWWQMARSNGIYVEDVKYDQSAEVYSIAISIRVDDYNGNFIGVIRVVYNIAGIIKNIEEIEAEKEYNTWEFTSVDANGRIIFSTKKYDILSPFGLFSAMNGKTGYFEHEDPQTGVKKLFAYARSEGYKEFKSLGWVLVINVDEDDVLKPINKVLSTILIFVIVLIVLAGAIGLYIYSTISASLRKFEEAIIEIAKGNLEARVDIKTKDEFYALAKAFNSMANDIKSLKRTEKKQKMQKELDALEASYRTGFISEETYKKERGRLEEGIVKANAIDAKLLQEKGFIKV